MAARIRKIQLDNSRDNNIANGNINADNSCTHKKINCAGVGTNNFTRKNEKEALASLLLSGHFFWTGWQQRAKQQQMR